MRIVIALCHNHTSFGVTALKQSDNLFNIIPPRTTKTAQTLFRIEWATFGAATWHAFELWRALTGSWPLSVSDLKRLKLSWCCSSMFSPLYFLKSRTMWCNIETKSIFKRKTTEMVSVLVAMCDFRMFLYQLNVVRIEKPNTRVTNVVYTKFLALFCRNQYNREISVFSYFYMWIYY